MSKIINPSPYPVTDFPNATSTPWRSLFPFPILLLVLILVPAILMGCARVQDASAREEHRFTGFLEAESVVIAPEIGGRILAIPVEEGDVIEAGMLLARLDDSRIRLELAQAEAQVARAEAELAQLLAAVRPEDVALAEARVAQAQAALQAAETALMDATKLRDHPQELDVQITQARAALAEAQAHARAAKHLAEAADLEQQMWGEIAQDLARGVQVTLPDGTVITVDAPPEKKQQANIQWNLASQKAWQAWSQAKQAENAAVQAQVALNDLLAQKKNPQEAEAQVVAATNARDQAAAALKQAEAALEVVKAGPSEEQIAAAKAAVEQARAARDAQATALTKTRILAPTAGVVLERYFSPGEVIAPGQQLLRITRPNVLTITIYVPAGMIDAFQVGTPLPLVIESAPDRRYTARILSVADEPEFTMRQSQNNAERAAVVYAVTLQVENPDDLLRPGLPADVLLRQP